jgi:hypothetical protein
MESIALRWPAAHEPARDTGTFRLPAPPGDRQVPLYADPMPLDGTAAGGPDWPGAGMPSLLADLLAATDPHARRAVLAAALQALGCDALGYTRLRWDHGRPVPLAACTAHSGGAWAQRYFAEGHEQVDPRLHVVATSALPCIWDIEHLHERAPRHWPQARVQRFVADLRATGARSGFMVAMGGPGPHERSCVSLRSPRPGTRHFNDQAIGQALTLAYCVHALYSRCATPAAPTHTHPAAPQPAPRTEILPIQADILRTLAQGLCDKQIAARLNLSAHNVDYHMRQLRKRYGVRNRVQLLESALRGQHG